MTAPGRSVRGGGGGHGIVAGLILGASQDARFQPAPAGDVLPDSVNDLPVQAAVLCFGERRQLTVNLRGESDIDGHALLLPWHGASLARKTTGLQDKDSMCVRNGAIIDTHGH